ncbi:transcription initiation protein [Empedobacter falsenii]|uniref:Transcription initiation protein n=1 Tax=Empedobacter falsenii TaxID=343874 RepID=A0A7H9DW01_9FLAO|nr:MULTISPECIES: YciI family protein [Empedobacter]HCC95725.1 transcription initiation protein [Flavobacteriaceae bacterium]MDH2207102.1 YciI family protein [Empedobacter sp. GD03644]MDM1062735.1 transcription initiation protein [Empedobacter falsenii]MDM1548057.1 transcription initiation protein [Empedobacter falsenii]MDM1552715.1 transcription initiation protein [Empedobacter falsenii]
MKNFVLLLRVNTNMDPGAFSDPKEVADRKKWLDDIQEKGIVKYLGGTMPPIEPMACTIFADGSIKEGPFKEVDHFLTGFLVIEVEDLESAKKIAKTNPILIAGGSVEVREVLLR